MFFLWPKAERKQAPSQYEDLLDSDSKSTASTGYSDMELPQKASKVNIKGKNKSSSKLNLEDDETEQPKEFSWPVYRKLLEYTRKRWKLAVATFLTNVAAAFLNSMIPYKIGVILDQAIATGASVETSRQALYSTIIWLLVIISVLAVCNFFRVLVVNLFQNYLAIDMREEIFSTFMKNDMYFFEEYKTGDLISRLNNDVNKARSAVSNNLTSVLKSVLQLTVTLIILLLMTWKLTMIFLAIIPVYYYGTLLYSRRIKTLIRKRQDISAEVTCHVNQKFSGIQVVKAYSNEDEEIGSYVSLLMKNFTVQYDIAILSGIYSAGTNFLPMLGKIFALWLGAILIINNTSELSAGELTAFILYCTSLIGSTSGLSSNYTNIINGTHSIQKVIEMLEHKKMVEEYTGKKVKIYGDVKFINVSFKYPTAATAIINNLSLHISKGEYVAFVGQSGSGKSTIVKLVERFYKQESGDILLDGHNIGILNVTHIRKQIGIVTQEAILFTGTVEENIAYGLEKYNEDELEEAAKQAGCLEFLNNKEQFPLRLQTVVVEKGANFSGGQRQRISIARALMRKPQMIIFDEATSALDANSEAMVQESIQKIANHKSNNVTIIVIAHRLSTVMKADRIYAMRNGQIIESGSHKELIHHKGYYYELVAKQLTDNNHHHPTVFKDVDPEKTKHKENCTKKLGAHKSQKKPTIE